MEIEDLFINEIKKLGFYKVIPKNYSEELRKIFLDNISLWYERILPKSKAEELYTTTDGDYSKIWHVHCECCFKQIDKDTCDICYATEDKSTWLCKECYDRIFK